MAYDVIFAHRNGGIGYKGGLPWHLPADLAYFKKITGNRGLVCAYDTYKSLPEVVKKRVVCIQSTRFLPNIKIDVMGNVNHQVLDIISKTKGDIVVIGGTSLYTPDIVLNANHVHVTEINSGEWNVDTWLNSAMMTKLKHKPYVIVDQQYRNEKENTPAYTIRRYYAKLSTTTTDRTSDGIL